MRAHLLLPVALMLSGCGTIHNLKAPPLDKAPPGIGPTACTPFGGVTRSALLGGFMMVCSPGFVLEAGKGGLLKGAGYFAGGVYGVFVDTPLSLAGDLVTFPIARARSLNKPWATGWGDQGSERPNPLVPLNPDADPAASVPVPPPPPPPPPPGTPVLEKR